MRAIRRGVKTNQAVLSPSSSLLSSSNYVPQSSKGGGGVAGHNGGVCGNNSNNNKNSNNINNNNIGATPTTSSSSSRHRRSSVKANKNAPSQQPSVTSTSASVPKGSDSKEGAAPGVPSSQQSNKATKALALSRHRSSGCLQSRHCHSTLSLSRARSSSALNRVQSRSMNLLMIQANGAKTTTSVAGTHNGTMAASNSSMSSNSSVVLVDDEEDEGVATDATTEGQLNNSKDIKSTSTSLTTPTGKPKSSRHARRGQGKAKNKDVGKDSNNTTHGIAQGKKNQA